MAANTPQYDYAFAGTGAAAAITYSILNKHNPHSSFLLVDKQNRPARHAAAFWHTSNATPLPALHTWDRYAVVDSSGQRHIKQLNRFAYSMHWSDEMISQLLKGVSVVHARVESADATQVISAGQSWNARHVFDSRWKRSGFCQLFSGRHLKLERPHSIHEPVLMDFTLPVRDNVVLGYQLPVASDEILIEVVSFGAVADIDGILDSYIASQGLTGSTLLHERGLTPLRLFRHQPGRIGISGTVVRASNGYGLPYFLRDAQLIAAGKRYYRPLLYNLSDLILLNMVKRHPVRAHKLLNRLVSRLSGDDLIAFLDETMSVSALPRFVSAMSPVAMLRYTAVNLLQIFNEYKKQTGDSADT
ncbi:MAG: Lycopene cyclase protein [candidate division WS6 bacterium OLB20]|uniref:Lycopene cyclase protein n=1 Tax=candidate division WS6 bacterium OLB20 TaxID=1617426 RepID=A0A136M0E9_9BACT|nr:MAG: Lycopene cyclase protein [candidate division WS6 bacterium OLB20]